MPELDGVGFVREQMARRPIPIVVVSIASESGELVLAALDAGAVDFVQKPTALATERLLEIGDELIEKVKAAARAAPAWSPATPRRRRPCRPAAATARLRYRRHRHLDRRAAGAEDAHSASFRPNLPVPIAIVLHMPVGYTELYARKLNELSALTVLEAQGGEVVDAGSCLPRAGGAPPDACAGTAPGRS